MKTIYAIKRNEYEVFCYKIKKKIHNALNNVILENKEIIGVQFIDEELTDFFIDIKDSCKYDKIVDKIKNQDESLQLYDYYILYNEVKLKPIFSKRRLVKYYWYTILLRMINKLRGGKHDKY